MSIINCPECGYEISDKSIECIKCGYPLNPKKSNHSPENIIETKSEEGCFLQTLNFGCMLVVGVILGLILLGFIFSFFDN